MGREGENLPLARASRPSAAGAERRVPCLADYSGGRLSFGNERAAPLAFPCADRVGDWHHQIHGADPPGNAGPPALQTAGRAGWRRGRT